ncbi:MAG: hypothetical protein KC486_07375 [Myxococcales bacterium]|nr:hypothetical protein [Myxococcales bacterium]
MAKPNVNQSAVPAKVAPEAEENESRAGWILGWVVVPGVILGGIFVGGAYVGANMAESWMTRAVMWLFG